MNTPADKPPARAAARDATRPSPLSQAQRALLQAALLARMRELDRRLARHHEGASRVEHAHELLERDADDAFAIMCELESRRGNAFSIEAKSTSIALASNFAGSGTRAQTFATSHGLRGFAQVKPDDF